MTQQFDGERFVYSLLLVLCNRCITCAAVSCTLLVRLGCCRESAVSTMLNNTTLNNISAFSIQRNVLAF